jgi:hypothetical protein
MNTMTMPGFTAEASLYSKGGFGMATVIENTTERVQPAMRYTCFTLGILYSGVSNPSARAPDPGMAAFYGGIARGMGCPTL